MKNKRLLIVLLSSLLMLSLLCTSCGKKTDPKNALVGTWVNNQSYSELTNLYRSVFPTGTPGNFWGEITFYADGSLVVKEWYCWEGKVVDEYREYYVHNGNYTLVNDGNRIRLDVEINPVYFNYDISNGILTLTSENGDAFTYSKKS